MLTYSHQVIITPNRDTRREPCCAGCSHILPWGSRCSLYRWATIEDGGTYLYVHPTAECEALLYLRRA
jgi:hypothetical protein